MTTSLTWPDVLVPIEVGGPDIVPQNTSGGIGLGGTEQVIGNTPPRWKMTLGRVAIRSAAQVKAWKKMQGAAQGRLNPFLVRIYDWLRAPGDVVTATANATMAAGATTVAINTTSVLEEGQHFSVAERLYRIYEITGHAGSVYTVKITPPIREAVASTTALNFADPVFRVKLAKDDAMDVSLDLHKFAQPSVDVIEDA